MFVGRKDELTSLNKSYNKDSFQFPDGGEITQRSGVRKRLISLRSRKSQLFLASVNGVTRKSAKKY